MSIAGLAPALLRRWSSCIVSHDINLHEEWVDVYGQVGLTNDWTSILIPSDYLWKSYYGAQYCNSRDLPVDTNWGILSHATRSAIHVILEPWLLTFRQCRLIQCIPCRCSSRPIVSAGLLPGGSPDPLFLRWLYMPALQDRYQVRLLRSRSSCFRARRFLKTVPGTAVDIYCTATRRSYVCYSREVSGGSSLHRLRGVSCLIENVIHIQEASASLCIESVSITPLRFNLEKQA